MHFDCSWIFRSFRGGEIRSEGTKLLVVCCCIKNYAKAPWLKTMNIYYHTVSVDQKFRSNLAGVQAQGFSGGVVRTLAGAIVKQRLAWSWKAHSLDDSLTWPLAGGTWPLAGGLSYHHGDCCGRLECLHDMATNFPQSESPERMSKQEGAVSYAACSLKSSVGRLPGLP